MSIRAVFFSPFMAYCFTFMLAMAVYLLNWSYLYPPLSWTLFLFFLGTFLVSFITACFLAPFGLFEYQPQQLPVRGTAMFFLVAGYVCDCAWSGAVPLLSLASGAIAYEDLRLDFGIPTFHVVLVGYNAFISIFFFHSYLSRRDKRTLLMFIASLVLPILIMSRITMTLSVIGCFYVYLFAIRRNLVARLARISAIGLLFLFGFGLLGNIRTAADVSADDVFLAIGDARDSFRESAVPKSFFWGYIYISSPLANLQLTVDKPATVISGEGLKEFVLHEWLWDSFSKKYDAANKTSRIGFAQINDAFNVGTIFARPYAYAGYFGMVCMFVFIWLISLLFILSLEKSSRYYLSYLCFYNALMILCVFDNMLTFTPFSLVLLFPLIERTYNVLFRHERPVEP